MIFRTKTGAAIAVAAIAGVLGAGVLFPPAQAAAASFSQQTGYNIAFQAGDSRFAANDVWTWSGFFSSGFTSGGLRHADIASGTTPSIAPLPLHEGIFQIAWHGTNGDLISTGPTGPIDFGVKMMPGTSPALTALSTGGYEIAYQNSNGILGLVGTAGQSFGTAMDPQSSPAITAEPNGGYEVAYQDQSHTLQLTGAFQSGTGYKLAPGTNPSITARPDLGNAFDVAIHGADDRLTIMGTSDAAGNSGYLMAFGTSPSIANIPPTPNGSVQYEAAFQGTDDTLWGVGGLATGRIGNPMAQGTSPAIAGVYLPATLAGSQLLSGWQIAYVGSAGTLRETIGSPAFTTKRIDTDLGIQVAANTNPTIIARTE